MNRILSYLKRAPKQVALAVGLISAMVIIPLHSMAAVGALMEGSIGVANQTKGETTYQASTNAGYDDVVKFQVFYHNRELPTSGNIAKNFKIKVNIPTAAGTNQVVKVTMGGDNTNTITDTASVVLNRADSHLEFIPGSVYWRHNAGDRSNINLVTQNIPDATVLEGKVIENVQPCHEFEATVTFMARVRVPSVDVTKVVRAKGDKKPGVTQMAAKAGDHLEYILTGKNLGNQTLSNVTLRDALPAHLGFVPGTVKLYNGSNPQGITINNDYLFRGGVNTGSVGPGASVFISFEAVVKSADELTCGANTMKNIAVVDTDQTGEYNANAIVTVNKDCAAPAYSCDGLQLTTLGNRNYRFVTKVTAKNGATVKQYSYDFGDGTTQLMTDKNTVDHSYSKDGSYSANVKVTFSVKGQNKTVESEVCKVTVNVNTTTPPPTTTLPNTGAGDIAGIFATTTVAGAVAHKLFLARKFARL